MAGRPPRITKIREHWDSQLSGEEDIASGYPLVSSDTQRPALPYAISGDVSVVVRVVHVVMMYRTNPRILELYMYQER